VNTEIRARVRGYLKTQGYKDGADVKAGQLLFAIEPGEYVAAVAQARGALARADSALALAQTQLRRARALMQTATIAERALDDATAAESDARGQKIVAEAALAQAQLNLSYTQMHSTIPGTAGLARVRVGNLVGADGPTLLTTVSQMHPMRVKFPLSETDYLGQAGRLQQLSERDLSWAEARFAELERAGTTSDGDTGVELILADGSLYKARGVIMAADRAIDPSTGTIQVEAWFPNHDGLLRPGQYGRVRMRRPGPAGSLLVADKALVQVQGTYSLAVVGAGNKVELRRVEVGPTAGADRVITRGVSEGERVVVEGLQKATDGAVVAPQPAPTASAAATTERETVQP
jgi:membrane fusion protein (multidrug efflux system)